jgi:hypothetical protein
MAWSGGNCFVAMPFCGEIGGFFSFMAEIASLACPNKLALLKDVNLSTESDIDIAIRQLILIRIGLQLSSASVMLTIVLRTTVKTITNCCNNMRNIDICMPSHDASPVYSKSIHYFTSQYFTHQAIWLCNI